MYKPGFYWAKLVSLVNQVVVIEYRTKESPGWYITGAEGPRMEEEFEWIDVEPLTPPENKRRTK